MREYTFEDNEVFASCMELIANDYKYNFNDCRRYTIWNTKIPNKRRLVTDMSKKMKELEIQEDEYLILSVVFR